MKRIMNERLSISETSPLKARFYDYQHFTYPWHFHPEYEIIYIQESSGTRFIGNNIGRYAAGDIFLIGSDLPHYLKSDEIYLSGNMKLRVKGTIIQFEKEFMRHAINHYPHFIKIKALLNDAQNGIYFPSGSSCGLEQLLNHIPSESGADQMISFLRLLKEMSEISSRETISVADYCIVMEYGASRIDKIISYLNKNYIRHISLNEISSFAAMNPAAFCRFFKNETGKSFKNYVSGMRTGYACKLLLMENMNISRICSECGFETLSHFNKTFKKSTGFSPSQYKKIMLDE